ncbi:MAG: hypothetical protein JRJ83_03280 [Deltaproteobacteria bacterium]|nr:hypothetical protein [Deltaproteobacteria bacterium]
MSDDRRLIEDYLPIQAISHEALRKIVAARFSELPSEAVNETSELG